MSPTVVPSKEPTNSPSVSPTTVPSNGPSRQPTLTPTRLPTQVPSTATPTTASPTPDLSSVFCVNVTLFDSFGDGWGRDIALKIWSKYYGPVYVHYLCKNNTWSHCFASDDQAHFDVVALDPPAKETWEIYWTVQWFSYVLADPGYEYFVGDFDTNMTVTYTKVDITDPVDYHNRTCDRCHHPPKPNPQNAPKHSSSSGKEVSDHENHDTKSKHTDGSSSGSSVGKPKPEWPFPFALFDTNGDGKCP
jgi:hypothetical protein